MKIGQNDLENLYFLLIIKTYHFFIQFSFKIGFLCFVPSGNVQKKCTLHVPFSFMLNEKGGGPKKMKNVTEYIINIEKRKLIQFFLDFKL